MDTPIISAERGKRPSGSYLSKTQIEKLLRCELQYRYAYVDRLKVTPGPSLRLGRVVHSALETLAQMRSYWDGPPSVEEVREAVSVQSGRGDTLAQAEELLTDASDALDFSDLIAVEEWFSATASAGGYSTTRLGGIMDLVRYDHDVIEVIDYKSGDNIPRREDVENGIQTLLYLSVARALWPDRDVRFVLHHLKTGTKMAVGWRPEMGQLLRTKIDVARRRKKRIKSEPETADPYMSTACTWCDYRHSCPAYEQLSDVPEVSDLNDLTLEEMAEVRAITHTLYKVAERKRKDIDKVFQPKLEAEGGKLEAADHTFSVVSRAGKTKYSDTASVLQLIAEHTNCDPVEVAEHVCNVNHKKAISFLKDVLGDDPESYENAKAQLAVRGIQSPYSYIMQRSTR